ncbi:hypothetical protein Avbf_18764 [Armadillidium vulgare]|nr:hypothetical protein Avbf_18764 [Armadillidium vulgare]
MKIPATGRLLLVKFSSLFCLLVL